MCVCVCVCVCVCMCVEQFVVVTTVELRSPCLSWSVLH